MSKTARIGVAGALLALVITVTLLILTTRGIRVVPSTTVRTAGRPHALETQCQVRTPGPPPPIRVGVALGGAVTQAKVNSFATAAGTRPTVVEIYRQFGRPFSWNLACNITRDGALPLINLSPRRQPVNKIAAGRYDGYLTRYAHEVARFKLPVAISFGHEMNGNWYPWGWKHTGPADFIAAWRHIYEVFAKAGVHNVTWVWIVSPQGRISSAQRLWWPGSSYVSWVGLDAYFRNSRTTFGVFSGMFAKVRKFTNRPVLITETGAAPNRKVRKQIAGLFLGVESHPGMLGFIWFDQNKRERWRLEDDPAAIMAFRRETRAFK